jgi:hypothetical protein
MLAFLLVKNHYPELENVLILILSYLIFGSIITGLVL